MTDFFLNAVGQNDGVQKSLAPPLLTSNIGVRSHACFSKRMVEISYKHSNNACVHLPKNS